MHPLIQRLQTKATLLTLYALSIMGVLLLWLIGPPLIEHAYNGTSWQIINNIIQGQNQHTLNNYLSIFTVILITISVTLCWCILTSYHLLITTQKESTHHTNNTLFHNKAFVIILYATLILFTLYMLIVFPGKTYFNIATHDAFIFYDAIYRITTGQAPHIDYHTPIGPLSYLLPYLGHTLQGGYAGSIEAASFIVALCLSATTIYLLYPRSNTLLTILTVLYLTMIMLVPIDNGTQGTEITHAMFYNRWSWAALTIILLTYLKPTTHSRTRQYIEATLLAFLITFLFYLKITYFLVALVYLFILALPSPNQTRLSINAAIFTILLLITLELKYHLTTPYLQDLYTTLQSSGAVRYGLMRDFMKNAHEYLLILLVIYITYRTLHWKDLLFITYVSGAGLAIFNQNSQFSHIVILYAILIWAASSLHPKSTQKEKEQQPKSNISETKILTILTLIFIAPTILTNLRGINTLNLAIAQSATKATITNLPNIYVGETKSYLPPQTTDQDPATRFNQLRNNKFKQTLGQGGEYISTINKGVELLTKQPQKPTKIMNLDMANPFNFLTNVTPPTNNNLWFHAGRNFSKENHPTPEKLFEDINTIMHPNYPMAYNTNQLLWEIYGNYITKNYPNTTTTDYWTLYSQNPTTEAN